MVDALPDAHQRAVMRLRYEMGHNPEQIAEGIGVCRRTVFLYIDSGKKELLRMFPDRFRVDYPAGQDPDAEPGKSRVDLPG